MRLADIFIEFLKRGALLCRPVGGFWFVGSNLPEQALSAFVRLATKTVGNVITLAKRNLRNIETYLKHNSQNYPEQIRLLAIKRDLRR